jgi:heme/copper-type cytochrome/quinol oxidase subunit 2
VAGEANTKVPRDWRAFLAIVVAVAGVVVIVILAVDALPGNVPEGEVNNKGQNTVAIASAAFTAISTVVAAYFGVKVANLAREEAEKHGERQAIRVAELAGAAEPTTARDAIQRASEKIDRLG